MGTDQPTINLTSSPALAVQDQSGSLRSVIISTPPPLPPPPLTQGEGLEKRTVIILDSFKPLRDPLAHPLTGLLGCPSPGQTDRLPCPAAGEWEPKRVRNVLICEGETFNNTDPSLGGSSGRKLF